MRRIKFDVNMIDDIRNYADSHTLLEACNRFTLTPNVMKRIASKHDIHFIKKPHKADFYIRVSKYSLSDVKTEYPEYSNIHEDAIGNIVCQKPEWYTGRKQSNTVYLHSVVFCRAIGITEIPQGYMICHADGDNRNMDINNLVLCTISCGDKLNLRKAQRPEKIRRDENPETSDND